MSTLNDIEAAVAGLSQDELTRFRQWFAEFDARHWDRQIEEDIRAGKLDKLGDRAIEHHRSDRCTPL